MDSCTIPTTLDPVYNLPKCSSLCISFRKRAEVPIYSFNQHQRLDETTSIYSPHVLILEGIFALYDPRILELLDMRVYGPLLPIVAFWVPD
jgi:pantothenate kinase